MKFYKDTKEGLEDIVIFRKDGEPHLILQCKECGEESKKISKSKSPSRYHAICEGCGHGFNIIEEKRDHYRKDTSMDAEISLPQREIQNPLYGTVSNISKTGLQLKTLFTPDLTEDRTGEIIGVKFALDNDPDRTISVQGKICYVNKNRINYTIGIAFTHTQPHEKDIAFYLFN